MTSKINQQEQHGLTWPSWWDGPRGAISKAWGVEGFPTFVLIDGEGVIRWRHSGVPPEGELERQIEAALARLEGAPGG